MINILLAFIRTNVASQGNNVATPHATGEGQRGPAGGGCAVRVPLHELAGKLQRMRQKPLISSPLA